MLYHHTTYQLYESKKTILVCIIHSITFSYIFFFFNDTATTEIYTLSLHDALPISVRQRDQHRQGRLEHQHHQDVRVRSEEHTSELQSRPHLVCRLLLEKKKLIILPIRYLQHRAQGTPILLEMPQHR